MRHPSLDLVSFIEQNILPRYSEFDLAHNIYHVNGVIRRSLALALKLGANINMTYVIAAYHDIGLSGPRAVHHLTGGKILASDARLKRWFSPQEILLMKEAVEDHRASASHSPRSIYGKIVAEADRNLLPDAVFSRAILYGRDHCPELDEEGQWKRFEEHMENKYGEDGYVKLWIANSENAEHLKRLRAIIADKQQLSAHYQRLLGEIVLGKINPEWL